MIKAENIPARVWLYVALMLIALRLPELVNAIAELIKVLK